MTYPATAEFREVNMPNIIAPESIAHFNFDCQMINHPANDGVLFRFSASGRMRDSEE